MEAPVTEVDMVHSPPHYKTMVPGVECIEVTENFNFCLGNAIKYIWRADYKGNPIQDLEKAAWYVQREIDRRKRAAKAAEIDEILSTTPVVPVPEGGLIHAHGIDPSCREKRVDGKLYAECRAPGLFIN